VQGKRYIRRLTAANLLYKGLVGFVLSVSPW
jgi:hypothetical protein